MLETALNVFSTFPADTILTLAETFQCTPLDVLNLVITFYVFLAYVLGFLVLRLVDYVFTWCIKLFRWFRSRLTVHRQSKK